MDPLLGEISLTSFLTDDLELQGTLSVVGNGCTVSADTTTNPGHASRLLSLVLPSPVNSFHMNLDNFTVSSFGNTSMDGSGMFLANLASSTLSSMTFEKNVGSFGGAVFLDDSSDVVFQSCVFQDNNASIYAAGVMVYTGCNRISFNNCSFLANIAAEDGGMNFPFLFIFM